MNLAYLNLLDFSFFSDPTKQLEHMIKHLQSDNCHDNEHGDIEQYIQNGGFEVLRVLFEGYLVLKAANEKKLLTFILIKEYIFPTPNMATSKTNDTLWRCYRKT